MPDKRGRKTDQERRFVEAYARTGDRAYAAEKAGYAAPHVSASQLLTRPAVLEAVAVQVQSRRERNMLAALDLVHEVVTNDKYPAAARVNAAKAIMTDYSRSAEGASDDKDPVEMSGAELRRRIERLQAEAAERTRPLLDLVAEEPEEEQQDTTETDLFE